MTRIAARQEEEVHHLNILSSQTIFEMWKLENPESLSLVHYESSMFLCIQISTYLKFQFNLPVSMIFELWTFTFFLNLKQI